MGIDRIGKGGGGEPPVAPTSSGVTGVGTSNVAPPARAFSAIDTAKADIAAKVSAVDVAPLERFRRGEVDIHGYLDLKVDEATSHLKGLPVAELDAVRKMLRDELASNPALAALVEHATGRVPPPPEE